MKQLSNLDLCKNELWNARIQNLASAPENPAPGQMYFDTTDSTLYVYTGRTWKDALYLYSGALYTDGEKSKLAGVASGATKTESSATNGYLTINGVNTKVYTHPGSGTNPHNTTKADVGLGKAENKSAAEILDGLTAEKVAEKLGFSPKKITVGLDADKGTATGSAAVYIASDTKKIWLDQAAGTWLQVGGQDTIAWNNVTGKPSVFPPAAHNHDSAYLGINAKAKSAEAADKVAWTGVTGKPSVYTPPIASGTVLGGIKVGANLSIASDGTLSAADHPETYLVRDERFVAAANQTTFKLSKGSYRMGAGLLAVYVNGARLSSGVVKEVSGTQFQLPAGLAAGDVVLAEYVQIMSADPYLVHGAEHLAEGADPIPGATTNRAGIVQLSDSVTSTYADRAATAKAVKQAYDKANHSHPYLPTTQKGAAGGVAELGSDGKVPSSQLPSFVDDVIEGTLSNSTTFTPTSGTIGAAGETGKIYVDTATGKTYRWSGTAYTEISASLALGETSSTAYRGDYGKIAYNHSQTAHVTGVKGDSESSYRTGNVNLTKANIGLGNVPNVTTNNQTPTYTAATALTALTSGEALSTAFGKMAKAVADLISHLADTTKHITASERTSWNARTKKYAVNIGNGSATELTVTHNLGTQDVTVLVRENASPYNQVWCDVQVISTTQIKLLFASAPASGAYRVVVTG
jgi:hypothetical protein